MKHTFYASFILLTGLLLSCASAANDPVVKLSNSGICHDTSSSFYSRTKNFTPYDSMEACIADGNRAPYQRSQSKSDTKQKSIYQPPGTTPKYDRDDYVHWIDTDSDCQNARHELLISTSQAPVTFTNWRKCTVKTGKWYDLYTNKMYTNARDLDIDHIVPLAYAHYRGASTWSPAKKQRFANDIDNLMAVDKYENRSKSAQGPADWMPPYQEYRCDYLASFVYVMNKYKLVFKSGEARVIKRMQNACGQ